MKQLKVCGNERVLGNVIEMGFSPEFFSLKRYGYNEFGSYDVLDSILLDSRETCDVLNQKTLEARIKRLHKYFPTAEYINQSVIIGLDY